MQYSSAIRNYIIMHLTVVCAYRLTTVGEMTSIRRDVAAAGSVRLQIEIK